MKLVIVESPTKCKTIGQYLGSDYKVMASIGHIRDLSTTGPGGLGVDVYNSFKPTYAISKDKYEVITGLKKAASKASEVILATDPDREGEAIAWHLSEVLNLPIDSTKRLEFHEITRPAILKALANPRTIDMNLVASQETRRIMDRIIGFRLSYLLQKKIKSRSAGRVQSVTLKFLVDREREIENFSPEEYWNVTGLFSEQKIKAELVSYQGKNIKISSEEEVNKVITSLPETFTIDSFDTNLRRKDPRPPFTTSTLQQEAFNQFHYSTKKTSILAQHLYEGIEINGELHGLITYMRTDSTRLSPEFVSAAKEYIKDNYGKDYVGSLHRGKTTHNIQDAHEAIRPTYLELSPDKVKSSLPKDEYNIYRLIYVRTLASLMSSRVDEVRTLKLLGNEYMFKAEASKLVFDGYDVIYKDFGSKPKDSELPSLGDLKTLPLVSVEKEQHFTKAPARFTEAKIVKLMEEKGIGRPSTYASTISTLSLRHYVSIEKGTMIPTDQGKLTVDELVKYFPNFMDPSYTAEMETKLDDIVAGDNSKTDLLETFYVGFVEQLDNADKAMEKLQPVETGENCPICGKPLVYRQGKYGNFVACSGYPECHYVQKEEKPEPEYVEGRFCPECGSPLIKRKSKSGNEFIGCSAFPKCHYIESTQKVPTELTEEELKNAPECPRCHTGHLIEKKSRFGTFLGCTNYPKCRYIEKIKKTKSKKDE